MSECYIPSAQFANKPPEEKSPLLSGTLPGQTMRYLTSQGHVGITIALELPGVFFFVFVVYSLLVAYYPRPIVYCVHPPHFFCYSFSFN